MDVNQKQKTAQMWAERAPTEDEIVDYCLRMNPSEGAVMRNSDLCVSPLVTAIMENGQLVALDLKEGKWLAGVIRVSDERQRSGRARKPRTRKRNSRIRVKSEGYSEEEQLRRTIRYCVQHRLAFVMYVDSGITGEHPADDPALIKRLLEKKAARYKRVYERTLLDPASLARRSPEEIASMRKYLDNRISMICSAGVDAQSDESGDVEAEKFRIRSERRGRGRPRRRAYFRQAFTQLWRDIEDGKCLVHTVTATDRSRLCRDADLETAFFEVLYQHNVVVRGLVEDISSHDGDPMTRGVAYMLAAVNEKRLQDIQQSSFRGVIQRLESGRPTHQMPWWIQLDQDGFGEHIPGAIVIVRRIIDLYLSGVGRNGIVARLLEDGITFDGVNITTRHIDDVLVGDTIAGYIDMYGLRWHVYPPAVDDPAVIDELVAFRRQRSDCNKAMKLADPRNWAEHTFAGLMRCSCGQTMSHNSQNKNRRVYHEGGYYRCTSSHVKLHGEAGMHASVWAEQLERFVGDLVSSNPKLLTQSVLADLDANALTQRQAHRAILEQAVDQAESEMCDKELCVRKESETVALNMGMTRDSPGFASIVEGLVANKLADDRRGLDDKREQLTLLRVEVSKNSRRDEFLNSLKELADWQDMDEYTRNRLLRSVFSQFKAYSPKCGNRIDIYLVGLDEPLFPIYVRYVTQFQFELPTIEQWVEDMVRGCAPAANRQPLYSKHLRSLASYYEKIDVPGADCYWDFCVEHQILPAPRLSELHLREQVIAHGADTELINILHEMYMQFLEFESERLTKKSHQTSSRNEWYRA